MPLYINTYGPLVMTRAGRAAQERHNIPPFVDGSIRREPDLQAKYPTISCICRAGKFAARLREGDAVIYMTKKGKYDHAERHWRLTAVLSVHKLFDGHSAAASWHAERGLKLPSNCVVPGNKPLPLSWTIASDVERGCSAAVAVREWDKHYQQRSRDHRRFVVCKRVWVDVDWSAPIVHEKDLRAIFGRVPGTRNPGPLDLDFLPRFMRHFGLAAPPSSQ